MLGTMLEKNDPYTKRGTIPLHHPYIYLTFSHWVFEGATINVISTTHIGLEIL